MNDISSEITIIDEMTENEEDARICDDEILCLMITYLK